MVKQLRVQSGGAGFDAKSKFGYNLRLHPLVAPCSHPLFSAAKSFGKDAFQAASEIARTPNGALMLLPKK